MMVAMAKITVVVVVVVDVGKGRSARVKQSKKNTFPLLSI